MNPASSLRFLRTCLHNDISAARRAAYLRFFTTTRSLYRPGLSSKTTSVNDTPERRTNERVNELKAANALKWPRIESSSEAITVSEFRETYHDLEPGANPLEDIIVTLRGRLTAFRVASKSLVFIDICQDGSTAQAVLTFNELAHKGITKESLIDFYHIIRRGDIISIRGKPHRTKAGELSIKAVELPNILSPSLTSLPTTLDDPNTRIRNRHVDMLVNRQVSDTLRVRSHIIQYLRSFLLHEKFLEVQTPLITDKASGAIAKPFTTYATEFPDKQLALRIAPEIWLKRLVIGGMDRVFEIGPSFRNEGLDATHNPEFTSCEFYKAFADLEDLISMTENMLSGMETLVTELRSSSLNSLPVLETSQFTRPFRRVQFIPAIEKGLNQSLPDLAAEDAQEKVITIFKERSLHLPASPTLPRLLDKLSAIYIEPDCILPTFIIHHPACMAPLAKSFLDPSTSQIISARAELFVQSHELANMYEEENSPFSQREKFLEQARWRDDENSATVDESYLEALEWGLPPTGGWGCGVDRLVMLFSGAKRISDVLFFGSLKNVVNLGTQVQD